MSKTCSTFNVITDCSALEKVAKFKNLYTESLTQWMKSKVITKLLKGVFSLIPLTLIISHTQSTPHIYIYLEREREISATQA